MGTGYSDGADQRLDAWIMDLYPSHQLERIAIEIKVSRGDFFNELKKPKKRLKALRYSNKFYFAAPEGLIKPTELPPEAGLLEVKEGGSVWEIWPAPYRETFPPTWQFMAAVMRRLQWHEVEKTDERKQAVASAMLGLKQGMSKGWREPGKGLTSAEAEDVYCTLKGAFDE